MKIDVKSEEGAILVLVGAIVTATLLLAILALVIDGGAVYLERRTVVNAAEAGALSLARNCAFQGQSCVRSTFPQELANLNSPDTATAVTEVCVNGYTDSLGQIPCRSLTSSKFECNSLSGAGVTYARVRTESQKRESDGSLTQGLSSFFSDKNRVLSACAQARWGNAASAPVYSPFAVSICEWAKNQTLPRTLTEFKTSFGVNDCNVTFTDQSGAISTKSGINGWAALDLLSSSLPSSARASVACPIPGINQPAYLRIGYQLSQITKDQKASNYCGDSELAAKLPSWLNQTLYLPLVSTVKVSGSSTVHTIEAFAAFKLLGYSLQPNKNGGLVPSTTDCPNNSNCIYGEFLKTISSSSEISTIPGVPNVGIQVIELS